MANRGERAKIAAETVAITTSGTYAAPSGRSVSVADSVRAAVESSELFTPGEAAKLPERARQTLSSRSFATRFDVRNQTTFAAARRLVERYGADRVAALNFASAKNPGGGFLSGSQAQEESLARASALVPTLERHAEYYHANRKSPSLLYTDHLIVSPRVPVFRDDDDNLLAEPWEVTILTSPAPNAGALAKNDPVRLPQVETTFRRRIEQVLSAAVVFRQTALVLGAWGCGVFGNSPAAVARLFGEHLLTGAGGGTGGGGGAFARAFEHVTFAVLDRGRETIGPFFEVFGDSHVE